ncbi:helix-turn-helix domain-containing protein [Edaphosphingomonas haloaromaticamans]|uniref:HTH cro/C1-type domain-containing protein n=1 Tax=Edaphosphingomonas haloaromaticamans TaxID=653954 RepID=A0A1S1HCR8_9SPHN|nr:helix-turn-helix transcriptional regulator [Sphingomonas haloaromaticamans]OHT19113.1 hypothetical protein BHE75_01096 [Sphingomonas haloaromaticamans]
MNAEILKQLGDDLRNARRARGLTQPELASRLGRDRARISELERGLRNNRASRDRLTLVAEICDALGLVPLLVPAARAAEVRALIAPQQVTRGGNTTGSAFEDVFVDLSDENGDD